MFQAGEKRRFGRDEQGATAIEFAFVAPILFFALFALVEIGVLGMVMSSLDNAVFDTSRRFRTGRSDAAASADQFKIQICERMGGVMASCTGRLTVSVQKFSKFYDANQIASDPPNGQFNAGGPGDIVLVKANYRWPLMTPFLANVFGGSGPFEVTIGSRAAFKNEPYS